MRFLFEGVDLAVDIGAADQSLHSDVESFREIAGGSNDLHGQFVSWSDDDGLDVTDGRIDRLQNGQEVGEGFTGTCGRSTNQTDSFQHLWYYRLLNLCWFN